MAAEADAISGKLHLTSTRVEPMEVAHNLMRIVGPRPETVTSYRSRQIGNKTFNGSQEIKPGLF